MKRIAFLLVIVMGCFSACKCPEKQNEDANNTVFKPITSKSMDISMFPEPKENEVQHLIELPPLENEENYKVEIFITKEMEVDRCNNHWLAGLLNRKPLHSWGYEYYVFETKGGALTTLMLCPDETLVKKEIYSKSEMLRYNSRSPIVIYTPKDYNAKYKIWNVSADEYKAIPLKRMLEKANK